MNILVVDDDMVDRESIKRALKESMIDCSIREVARADEAIEICRDESFDLILLDYRMPGRDGIEVLLEIEHQGNQGEHTVVMMSNSEDEQLALQCIEAGAQDFLLKKDITSVRLRRAAIQARKRHELELELRRSYRQTKMLAERDPLTRLANRYLFEESFKIALANNSRSGAVMALLMFDLDNFKLVNDTFGHNVGDMLLKAVCERILKVLRGNELFSRLGGDEFAIMLSNLTSLHDSTHIAERILSCMQSPFEIAGHQVNTNLSIGIALCRANEHSAEELLKFADIAMYRSKQAGRGQFSIFEEGMQQATQRRLKIEHGLAQAINRQELSLLYQPVLAADSLQVVAVEALLRWQWGEEQVSPVEFIPVAEETKQMLDIGRWVIGEAIRQMGEWKKAGMRVPGMAINLSAIQLGDSGLAAFIDQCRSVQELAPELLEFELTETALIDERIDKSLVLNEIVRTGSSIALDDFGTGYSSIAHLMDFPIRTVKLDKSLMPTQHSDDKSRRLLQGLAPMLHTMNMEVVAEGIETEQQEQLLQQLGVDRLQGYRYSKPVSADEIASKYLQSA